MRSATDLATIVAVTIQIPDDLARGLEKIAKGQKISVEQLAVERLQTLVERPTSANGAVARDSCAASPKPRRCG